MNQEEEEEEKEEEAAARIFVLWGWISDRSGRTRAIDWILLLSLAGCLKLNRDMIQAEDESAVTCLSITCFFPESLPRAFVCVCACETIVMSFSTKPLRLPGCFRQFARPSVGQ